MSAERIDVLRSGLEDAVGLDAQYLVETPERRLDPFTLITVAGTFILSSLLRGALKGASKDLELAGEKLYQKARSAILRRGNANEAPATVSDAEVDEMLKEADRLMISAGIDRLEEVEDCTSKELIEIGVPAVRAKSIVTRVAKAITDAYGVDRDVDSLGQ
jgi:hypothetical protein